MDRTVDLISKMLALEPLEHSVRKEPLDAGGGGASLLVIRLDRTR